LTKPPTGRLGALVIAGYLARGQQDLYYRYLNMGHRVGQAFVNTLSTNESQRLIRANKDPYYSDSPQDVIAAIEFLTEPS
jgi:hypothetical protein